ncbi:WG repeat-containing protein [Leptospira neocaledonica]|uniref:WG repeat-containing protein n=1 Tax=Leptospira neocaledonica TaxID=2023192 RepID=UPI0013FD6011|nr:WG repeat-containing protein [Leptospira neocaledonica]
MEGVYNLKERKFQIPPTYDEIRSAEEGLFIVRKDRKTFYINENNESVFPLTFNSARNFSEGLATVGRDDKYAYIDRKGNLITDFIFEAAGDFHEGLALVCLNGKYGYIDRKGNLQIPAQFDREDYFYNGRTVVLQNGKKYLIDTSGEKISSGYDNIDKYNEFLILAFKNNSAPVALLDWNGKNILHTNISYVRNQADGNIIVETEKRNPNFILNAKGEILFTTKNPLHQVQYDNGYFISKIPEYPDQEPDNSSNKNYLINIKDKSQKTIPAGEIEYFREGIFLVHENDKKYYMNVLLEKIPATSSIKTFSQFNNGLASVEIDQKYGMIDKSGAFVIPPIFDKIGENIDGKYIVVKDKQSGLLDLESCLR